jgi:hypothetical protein
VDDYTRIVRLYIMQKVDGARLNDFQELGTDLLTFPDDGNHNYFAHVSSLLNVELLEAVSTRDPQALRAPYVACVRCVRYMDVGFTCAVCVSLCTRSSCRVCRTFACICTWTPWTYISISMYITTTTTQHIHMNMNMNMNMDMDMDIWTWT